MRRHISTVPVVPRMSANSAWLPYKIPEMEFLNGSCSQGFWA